MLKKQFEQRAKTLEEECKLVEATKHSSGDSTLYVDPEKYTIWKTKVKSFLISLCGEQSPYYKDFQAWERKPMFTNYGLFSRQKAIFQAAKEDLESGYLISLKRLIQAEIFDIELEQAEELWSKGHYLPAAVVARIVLETGLRGLCNEFNVQHGSIEKMNSELRKAEAYGPNQQKQVTSIAAIGNSAAHGRVEEFNAGEVKLMIDSIRNFLATHLE